MRLKIIEQRNLWWFVSSVIIVAGLVGMVISMAELGAPIRPGLDFVGGTRIELALECAVQNNCTKAINPAEVRAVLNTQDLGKSGIQIVDNYRLSIQTSKALSNVERQKLEQSLAEKIGNFDPKSTQIDTVSPAIGKELFSSGILALLLSFLGIGVYLTFRFKLDYAILAIVALVHDVLITSGSFAIFGLVFGIDIDSLFLVALLTIIGFSVNDTVIIYDRIRENEQLDPGKDIDTLVDDAVNQTLTRSINTTMTTLLPLTAIFLFGGETLKNFALALIIGFIAGAYSSIFIASTLLAFWRERNEKIARVAVATGLDPSSSDRLSDEG